MAVLKNIHSGRILLEDSVVSTRDLFGKLFADLEIYLARRRRAEDVGRFWYVEHSSHSPWRKQVAERRAATRILRARKNDFKFFLLQSGIFSILAIGLLHVAAQVSQIGFVAYF
jgi:hypothetical protein